MKSGGRFTKLGHTRGDPYSEPSSILARRPHTRFASTSPDLEDRSFPGDLADFTDLGMISLTSENELARTWEKHRESEYPFVVLSVYF